MARILENKELVNTRLATNYGGWIYCDHCNENIGYLCYSTYDKLDLSYICNCGSQGSAKIDFCDSKAGEICNEEFLLIKNRFCCPNDNEPLITILDKKLEHYDLNITCKSCSSILKRMK